MTTIKTLTRFGVTYDAVEVRDNPLGPWRRRILISTFPEGCGKRYVCVSNNSMRDFIEEKQFTERRWRYMQKIPTGKTVKAWLQELPAGYRARALAQRQCPEVFAQDMASALKMFAAWIDTEEKDDFWRAVWRHYDSGDPLPPLPVPNTGPEPVDRTTDLDVKIRDLEREQQEVLWVLRMSKKVELEDKAKIKELEADLKTAVKYLRIAKEAFRPHWTKSDVVLKVFLERMSK